MQRKFFVWMSDIHIDPYYGVSGQYGDDAAVCPHKEAFGAADAAAHPYGAVACDPPERLWESALEAARRVSDGAEFVVFTGDFARHHQDQMPNPRADVGRTVSSVAGGLSRAFRFAQPDNIVIGALGNTDSREGYRLRVTNGSAANPWLSYVADRMGASNAFPRSRLPSYIHGGFFETNVGGLMVLSINTIMYSVLHTPAEPRPADPFGQFAWLRERLEAAARMQERVWIVGHIPPGMETYGYQPLWHAQYVGEYLDIVQDARLGQVIGAQLFGHVHADEFRYLPDAPAGAGPIWLTGALSPVYRSNPSFRLVEYDASSGRLLNIQVYYAEMQGVSPPEWRFGYDLLGAYPALRDAAEARGGLTNDAFRRFAARLRGAWARGGAEFDAFARWHRTRIGGDLLCVAQSAAYNSSLRLETKRRYVDAFICALRVGTAGDFRACAETAWADVGVDEAAAARPRAAAEGDLEWARRKYWERIAHASEAMRLSEVCDDRMLQGRSAAGGPAALGPIVYGLVLVQVWLTAHPCIT